MSNVKRNLKGWKLTCAIEAKEKKERLAKDFPGRIVARRLSQESKLEKNKCVKLAQHFSNFLIFLNCVVLYCRLFVPIVPQTAAQ